MLAPSPRFNHARQLPPGRASISHRSTVHALGPNQRTNRTGSVHALNRNARVARMRRLTPTTRSRWNSVLGVIFVPLTAAHFDVTGCARESQTLPGTPGSL